MTVAKSAFYVFDEKLTCAGLQPDFSQIPKDLHCDARFLKQRLPADFKFKGPLLLGSVKPPEKSYDICCDHIVSEKLAQVIRDVVGDEVKLFPYEVRPDPKSKYPITGNYYYVDMPYVDCFRYEYGPEEPTWEWARKGYEIYGKPFPATCRPVIDITIDVEATAGLQLFRPVDMLSGAMMTHKLWKACKAAKVIGMVNMTAEYYFYIDQFSMNQRMGSAYGTHLAQKNP